ncbi:MAG: hypothetical protein H6581_05730 [Bacteroidia bacterium]|nr:hypothetical protein [Bacteroidia bacterium]
MFKGSDIPGVLNIPNMLDRTLYVFRHRYYPYLMICLVSFGIPFLLVVGLYILGIIDFSLKSLFDKFAITDVEGMYANFLIINTLLVSIPALYADICLQYYTSYLIRDREITWLQALRKGISRKTLQFIPVKIMGNLFYSLAATVLVVMIFIPLIGSFAWLFSVVALYSLFVGMAPAILVEERKTFLGVVSRNLQLARQKFWVVATASGLGMLIVLVFTLSLVVLFVIIALLGLSLTMGSNNLFAEFGETGTWIMGVILFTVPMVNVLLLVPLQSIFYSVLYYNMRSRQEAFHLSNKVEIYTQKLKRDSDTPDTMRATA